MNRLARATVALSVVLAVVQPSFGTEGGGALLDAVRETCRKHFYDPGEVRRVWPDATYAELRARVVAAPDAERDLAIIHEGISLFDASHFQLMPAEVYRRYFAAETDGRATPRLGLELEVRTDAHETSRAFVADTIPGGAADEAGVRRGDEVVAIEGVSPWLSPRVFAQGDRRPGDIVRLLFIGDEPVGLALRTTADARPTNLRLTPRAESRCTAVGKSVRVIRRAGLDVGYLRIYHVLSPKVFDEVRGALAGPLKDVDGIVLDLRGWGGRVDVLQRLLNALPKGRRPLYSGPLVAIIDESARSAKEVCAFRLAQRGIPLVGRQTAGAVLGTAFYPVGTDHVLMLPIAEAQRLTGVRLEGTGVTPNVYVADALPYAQGRDELIDAAVSRCLQAIPEPLVESF